MRSNWSEYFIFFVFRLVYQEGWVVARGIGEFVIFMGRYCWEEVSFVMGVLVFVLLFRVVFFFYVFVDFFLQGFLCERQWVIEEVFCFGFLLQLRFKFKSNVGNVRFYFFFRFQLKFWVEERRLLSFSEFFYEFFDFGGCVVFFISVFFFSILQCKRCFFIVQTKKRILDLKILSRCRIGIWVWLIIVFLIFIQFLG